VRRNAKAPRIPASACGGARGHVVAARLVVIALLGLAFLALAPSAFAAKKYVPVAKFPRYEYEEEGWIPSSFGQTYAESIAVNDKNSHIYVADTGRGAIWDYESITDKEPERWNGTSTPAGSFGGSFLSVAADNTTGDVYVADRTDRVIDKFDQNGNLITTFGDTEPLPNGQLAGLKTPAKSFSPSSESYTSFPIAVNQANHDLYVADPGHSAIDIFDENGVYMKQITATAPEMYREGGRYTTGLAVNGNNGHVYLTDLGSPNLLFEFDSAGNYVSTWNGSNTPSGNFSLAYPYICCLISVAVEESSGHVLVGAMANRVVDTFDEAGSFLPPELTSAEFPGEFRLYYVAGVAIDQATGYLYVSQNGQVEVFKSVIVPDVTAASATEETATSATVHGHVDPAAGEGGGTITECHFQIVSNFSYEEAGGESSPWAGAIEPPCSPTPTTGTDVSAVVTGLDPATEYRFRLIVGNASGENIANGENFTTVGPWGFAREFGSSGSAAGQLDEPKDVAVDTSSGAIYVADSGNHRVDKFDAAGNFVAAWGWGVRDGSAESQVCTSTCQAGIAGTEPGQFEGPRYVEVDNSGGPSADDVYVADTGDAVVQKFEEGGQLITTWGTGGASGFSKEGKEGEIAGISVDTLGNLFVATGKVPYYWTEVGQDGVSRVKFPTNVNGGIELGQPNGGGIELDATGSYYETQGREGHGVRFKNPRTYAYSGHDVYPAGYRELSNSGLAVDRPTNDLYVDQGSHIDRFPTSDGCEYGTYGATGQLRCAPRTFGNGHLSGASGLTFDSSRKLLYAANTGDDDIAVFAPTPDPTPTTGPADVTGPTSVTLTGHVDTVPGGGASECHFDYIEPGAITDEYQKVTLAALTATGDVTAGSRRVSGVTGASGTFTVGETIEGPGIPEKTKIISVEPEPGTLDLSNVAEETATSAAIRTKPTGGSFTLTFNGQTTRTIEYKYANPGGVGEALEHLRNVRLGSISAAGGTEGGPYLLRFKGNLAETNVPQITSPANTLEPAGSTVTVETLTEGYGWGSAMTAPCSPAAPITSSSDVSAAITGVVPLRTYDYRLVTTGQTGLTAFGQAQAVTAIQGGAPSVHGTSSSGVTPGSATLSAQINPNLTPTVYRFQYGTDTTYGLQTPPSETIGEDDQDHSVSTEITGLIPGKTYHYRVLAINVNGPSAGPDEIFNTPDHPTVAEPSASEVSATGATLSSKVKAGFSPTTYTFEYGATRAYGSSTGGQAGSDNTLRLQDSRVTGLAPGVTYHFRVLAVNAIGSAASADQTFTTAGVEEKPKTPTTACKKGFVRRHGKCVKKRHHRKHHHKRGTRHG
jgi:DNA-binding beta-propeller fold protein YncE